MKRNKLSMLGAGFAIALAGLTGTVQAAQPLTQTTTQNEIKATPAKGVEREARKVHSVGGLDLMQVGNYGMSPKEYGIRYGNGGSKKSNRLRLSHNAKLKRR